MGGLTELAASDMRLPPGLPVIQGGADSQVALVGLGVRYSIVFHEWLPLACLQLAEG